MDYDKGGGFIEKYFFANLTDSGNSKTFSFFLSYDSMDDLMPDFLGDINISQYCLNFISQISITNLFLRIYFTLTLLGLGGGL